MTTSEAAKQLGVARVTIYQAIRRGTLPAKLIGRDYEIHEQDVIRYSTQHRGAVGRKPQPSPSNKLATANVVLQSLAPRNRKRVGEPHQDYLARVAPHWLAEVRQRVGAIQNRVTSSGSRVWWREGFPEIVSSHSAARLIQRERQFILSTYSAALEEENQKRHSQSVVAAVHEFADAVNADVVSVDYSQISESIYITLAKDDTRLLVRYSGHLAQPSGEASPKDCDDDGVHYQIRSPENIDRACAVWTVDFHALELSPTVLAAAWNIARLRIRGNTSGRVFIDDLQLRSAYGIPS